MTRFLERYLPWSHKEKQLPKRRKNKNSWNYIPLTNNYFFSLYFQPSNIRVLSVKCKISRKKRRILKDFCHFLNWTVQEDNILTRRFKKFLHAHATVYMIRNYFLLSSFYEILSSFKNIKNYLSFCTLKFQVNDKIVFTKHYILKICVQIWLLKLRTQVTTFKKLTQSINHYCLNQNINYID